MKISSGLKKAYPKLAVWIETNLPLIKKNSRVWTAFLKYSELNSTNGLSAISLGFPPEINVNVMPGANGQFSGSTSPNKIFLAKSICEKFEKDQAGEEGKAFEMEAYGKDINRYW